MSLIRKFLRMILKIKMRSKGLKDSRNIIHQLILYFIYFKSKKLLLRNKNLKNTFIGKRCFILFTGTSITDFDFDLIKNEPVIACGASVLHKDFRKCNVIAYLNPGPWEPRSLLFLDIIFSSVFRKSKKGCSVILHTTAFPYLKKISYFREDDAYFIASDGNYLSSSDVNIDLQTLNNIQEGSLSTALGVASYMGFKEIYLLGADYLTDPPVYGHFYDGFYEIGRPSDYKEYRERTSLIIDHIENKNLGLDKLPNFKVQRENGSLKIEHIWNKKSCSVVNIVKDSKQISSLKSLTFEDLKNMKAL
jgi:hypothetical protein